MKFTKGKLCTFLLVATLLLNGCSNSFSSKKETAYKINSTTNYKMTDSSVINPYIGFVCDATNPALVGDNSLVYIDVTFRELQPQSPDSYSFDSIDSSNNVAMWKEQGKHAVLRFICDSPSAESHSDIPDWLMSLTGDGTYYSTSYGSGYSPDYNNETFINHHKKAVEALAEHYDDGFVAYVQLGSIGHWGEWYVNTAEGVPVLPVTDVRHKYISHYVQAFENAKLVMFNPFAHAQAYKTGLHNNMLGSEADTREWLDLIQTGGAYTQTGEETALVPMSNFWHNAPSGAEFTGSVPIQSVVTGQLNKTLDFIKESHTSFIGPNSPLSLGTENAAIQKAIEKFRSVVGYRLGITRVTITQQENFEHMEIILQWENSGVAPVYFDLPVGLYVRTNNEFKKIADVNVDLKELMPDSTVTSQTIIPESSVLNADSLYVGITDGSTGKISVKLISEQNSIDNYTEIYKFK